MKTRTKKCKNCGNQFTPYTSLQKFCTESDCIRVMVRQAVEKEWKKKKAKKKEELMTVQDWIKIAQQTFNKYIRLRDKDKGCISCGKPLNTKFDCGHFFNANNHWSLRFDERNCNGQCVECNQWKHGHLLEYRKGIIKRYGQCILDELEEISTETRKYSIDELKEIVILYKQKIKDYEKKAERP